MSTTSDWQRFVSPGNRPQTAQELRVHAELGEHHWRRWDAYRRYRRAAHGERLWADPAVGVELVGGIPFQSGGGSIALAGHKLSRDGAYAIADRLIDAFEGVAA